MLKLKAFLGLVQKHGTKAVDGTGTLELMGISLVSKTMRQVPKSFNYRNNWVIVPPPPTNLKPGVYLVTDYQLKVPWGCSTHANSDRS